MYDEKLFNRLIDCELSFEELRAFFPQDEREYDLDDSFDKYFSLDKIKKAIELYNSKKIDCNYLAYWACAYCWIFMATNWNNDSDDITLARNIEWAIADWFDSVSFFDEELSVYGDPNYLKEFYKSVEIFYDMRRNINDWTAYYQTDESCVDPDDEAIILCVNEKNKCYTIFSGFFDEKIKCSDHYLCKKDFDAKVRELAGSKFRKLKNSNEYDY